MSVIPQQAAVTASLAVGVSRVQNPTLGGVRGSQVAATGAAPAG
jgi:hypothetical protein